MQSRSKQPDLCRKSASVAPKATAPALLERHLPSPTGEPLDGGTRALMESRFRHDFSQVRVTANAESDAVARALGAQAFTSGHHIMFAAGTFAPASAGARRLIAHELTHVLQQSGAGL